ncbi:hypothetical protein [Curvibacter gracilis]|uniref:hypothetical protein n=1 Tax=Curvibacter gracilis TaxID=230310 RepID=UPI000487AE45|nr:hypothetical protein [Curvibacter gracilis]
MTEDQLERVLEVFEAHYPGHRYTVELNAELPTGIGGYADFKHDPIEVMVAKHPTVDLERHYLIHELAHVVCGLAAEHNEHFQQVNQELADLCDAKDMLTYLNGQEANQ